MFPKHISLSWVYIHPRYVENTSNTSSDQTRLNPGETSKSLAWMSRWKLGSMARINGLCYNLLINGVYWDSPLILTFDPNFQPDIQVFEKEHHLNQTSISGLHVNCPGCAPLENNHGTWKKVPLQKETTSTNHQFLAFWCSFSALLTPHLWKPIGDIYIHPKTKGWGVKRSTWSLQNQPLSLKRLLGWYEWMAL